MCVCVCEREREREGVSYIQEGKAAIALQLHSPQVNLVKAGWTRCCEVVYTTLCKSVHNPQGKRERNKRGEIKKKASKTTASDLAGRCGC